MSLADGKLIETLQEALKEALDRSRPLNDKTLRYHDTLQLLSQPDALAWALLEEMAERGTECRQSREMGLAFTAPQTCATVYVTDEGEILCDPCTDGAWFNTSDEAKPLVLILARAIKEQEGRVRDA